MGFSSQGPNRSLVQSEIEISQQTHLIIKSDKKDIKFLDLLSKLNIFVDLLQIASQRIPYTLSVVGLSEKNSVTQEKEVKHYPEIQIYFKPIEALTKQKTKIPQEFLYTYNDLTSKQIISWFDSFEDFKNIYHLYRSLFFTNRLFIETKFLYISQALESLHSLLFENRFLSKSEFKARKEKILGIVPDDLREWILSALNSANYKRFRVKIFELLDNKAYIFNDLIDDNDLFAKKVRDTRNEFVHHNELKWMFRGIKELVLAINTLTLLFESYILEVIGFPQDKVLELLSPKINTQITGWTHLRE